MTVTAREDIVAITSDEDVVAITSELCDDISMWYSIASYQQEADDQTWFWTSEWQAGEKEATAEIQKGQLSKKFHDAEEIRAYLSTL